MFLRNVGDLLYVVRSVLLIFKIENNDIDRFDIIILIGVIKEY